jgi:hypothetical protein
MDFKQILFYTFVFILGLIVGKVVKINVKTSGGCPIARNMLQQLKQQMQSENSETYL